MSDTPSWRPVVAVFAIAAAILAATATAKRSQHIDASHIEARINAVWAAHHATQVRLDACCKGDETREGCR